MIRASGLVLLLGACAMEAPAPAPTLSSTEALVARLPESVGGFRRGAITPLSDAGSGNEVAYATANRSIAGYVQVLRADAPVAAETELRRFAAEATTGAARRLRERAQVTIAPFNCVELEGTFGRQPVEGLACAGAIGGQLVRLRLSMTRRVERMAEARGFAEGIAAALR